MSQIQELPFQQIACFQPFKIIRKQINKQRVKEIKEILKNKGKQQRGRILTPALKPMSKKLEIRQRHQSCPDASFKLDQHEYDCPLQQQQLQKRSQFFNLTSINYQQQQQIENNTFINNQQQQYQFENDTSYLDQIGNQNIMNVKLQSKQSQYGNFDSEKSVDTCDDSLIQYNDYAAYTNRKQVDCEFEDFKLGFQDDFQFDLNKDINIGSKISDDQSQIDEDIFFNNNDQNRQYEECISGMFN